MVLEALQSPSPIIEARQHSDIGNSLARLGKKALSVVGISLALMAAEAPAAGYAENALPQAEITTPLSPAATPATDPAIYSGPIEGVATDSWNGDGLGQHTLFEDMADEGLSEVRLELLVNKFDLPSREMRAELDSVRANDIEPVVSIPLNMPPQQAADVAAHLPGVTQFVIGNEVNSPYFSKLTPAQYVELLAHTNSVIHAVRPDAQTRGFALASGYDPIGYLTKAKQIADLYYGGLDNIMDGLDVHLYRTESKDLQMLISYMQLYDGSIYVGEYGWIVNDSNHPGSVSFTEQADNELALRAALIPYPQVKSLDMFRFRSQSLDPFDTANVSRLGVKRAAYYVLQSTLMTR